MRRFLALTMLLCAALIAAQTDYLSAKRKFQSIERYQVKPGTRVPISSTELNSYVRAELREAVPQGVREPSVELQGGNIAVGRAMINFLKVQNARGGDPGWLMKKLLDGEHEVVVTAKVNSSAGRATVYLQRVEVGGIPIEGGALDFLIDNYLLPNYPNAQINRPFELKYRMERLEVSPGVAYVVMKQ
ncbi:MAG: hypothetical protein ABJF23_34340, partial [Bryobacteraceae bacterium]